MITNTTKQKTRPKPTDYDINLKYLCPNCSQEHWLSYLESSTKNFKIVCECGAMFLIKRVIGFELKYQKKKKKQIIEEKKPVIGEDMPENLLVESTKVLIQYGFTENEAKKMLVESYQKNPLKNISELIKRTLAALGDNNE